MIGKRTPGKKGLFSGSTKRFRLDTGAIFRPSFCAIFAVVKMR